MGSFFASAQTSRLNDMQYVLYDIVHTPRTRHERKTMIEPAPKVEPATAHPARPSSAPRDIDPAPPSGKVTANDVSVAPRVGPAYADPPTERGSILASSSGGAAAGRGVEAAGAWGRGNDVTSSSNSSRNRDGGSTLYESYAAVVVGPAEKNAMQRLLPRRLRTFDDRSVVSYGECKRYVVVSDAGEIRVYSDASDDSPLYVVPLSARMRPRRERPMKPHYRSHAISPMIQQGGMIARTRSRKSLDTVLLVERSGGSGGGGGGGERRNARSRKGCVGGVVDDKNDVDDGDDDDDDDDDIVIKYQFSFDVDEAGDDASSKFVNAVLLSSTEGPGG